MSEQSILINGIVYTRDELVKKKFTARSDFEESTLNFCYAWLTGAESFKLTTSGSTGAPKQVTFTRDQMTASARKTKEALKLTTKGTSLICIDTRYIGGQMMLARSFVLGLNIIGVTPSANPLSALEPAQKIDFAAFVPYQLQSILNSNPEKLNQIGVAIVGGAAVDENLKERLVHCKCDVYATYGMTETISHIALMKLSGSNSEEYFKTFPGISIRLDERGCLVIQTDFLNEEIITNDLVEIKNENQFQWLGRWDNIINTGGIKVIPEKTENELKWLFKSHGLSSRYFLSGIPDHLLGQKVCLYIEGNAHSDHEINRLKELMKLNLNKFEFPKEIKFVKQFQETNTGKIDRNKTVNLFPI